MQHHDIFFLFSNWRTLRRDWRLLGNDLVTHIWADDRQVLWCFNDSEGCIQSSVNLRGMYVHFFASIPACEHLITPSDRHTNYLHSHSGVQRKVADLGTEVLPDPGPSIL